MLWTSEPHRTAGGSSAMARAGGWSGQPEEDIGKVALVGDIPYSLRML
jgi:hypothetical protein